MINRERVNSNSGKAIVDFAVDNTAEWIRFRLERSTKAGDDKVEDPELEAKLWTEFTVDNGQTWQEGPGLTLVGGIIPPRPGTDASSTSETTLKWNLPSGTGRRMRGGIEKQRGGRIKTFLTIEDDRPE